MKWTRNLTLALALLGPMGAVSLLAPVHALAADPDFDPDGLIELLPMADVVGDGATPVTAHLLALDFKGQPMKGLRLRASVSAGEPGEVTEVGNGIYAVEVVPPAVTTPTEFTLVVKGRTNRRVSFEKSMTIAVRPPFGSALGVVANPAQMVLGQDEEATLSFRIDDLGAATSLDDLDVRVSSGEVQNLTYMGSGRFTARYVAPKVNYPQLALVTVADRRDRDKLYAATVIPLQGKTNYPVPTRPGATVILRIAGRDYGPVTANDRGRVMIPVIVPPGVEYADKVEVVDAVTNESRIDLRVPETKRLTLFPMPDTLVADEAGATPVRVAVFTRDGQPDEDAEVSFVATGGTVSEPVHEGGGIYSARFTPTPSAVGGQGNVRVSLKGSSVQVDAIDFELAPGRPRAIELRPDVPELLNTANAVKVFAKVKGPGDAGIPSTTVYGAAAGARRRGAVQDLRNGDYRLDFTTEEKTHVDVAAVAVGPITGDPVRHVVVVPTSTVVPADGTTHTLVTLLTLDQQGLPVPNQTVNLAHEGVDGRLPTTLTTNRHGVGFVYLRSGREQGLHTLVANVGKVRGTAAILQTSGDLEPLELPASGSAAHRNIAEIAPLAVATLRVMRQGTTAEPAPRIGLDDDPVGVARLEVAATVDKVRAGGEVPITLRATDQDGAGVAGEALALAASVGTFGPITDEGGGAYSATLSVPRTATGSVRITVTASSGEATADVVVPVDAAVVPEDAASVSDAIRTAGEILDGSKQPSTAKPAPAASTAKWFRARLSFTAAAYNYEQLPFADPAPLLDSSVTVGGEGQPSGTPIGAEVQAKAWLDAVGLPYIGFDGGYRLSAWSLTAPEFGGVEINDVIQHGHIEVAARYPYVFGEGSQFYLAARLGAEFSDFLYFTGSFDNDDARYETLVVPAFRFGGEVGVDIGPFYARAAVLQSLQGTAIPFATTVDVNLGYDIAGPLFVDVGLLYQSRSSTVFADRDGVLVALGALTDDQVLGRVGLGVGF